MKGTILIAEDHEEVRTSLCDWLSVAFPGYTLCEATSGEEAVNKVVAQPPALVLMDVGLPRMNGIQATRMIKSVSSETKVVILTNHEDPRYQAEAASAGASGYVFKRKMHTELVPILTDLLAQRERRQSYEAITDR